MLRLTGNTNVTINDGEIYKVYGGGGDFNGSSKELLAGTTSVTVNEGTIHEVYGGADNNSSVLSDTFVTVNSGTITNVYGGEDHHAISGLATVRIGVDAVIETISYSGNSGTIASGSHMKYESAFYNIKDGTRILRKKDTSF